MSVDKRDLELLMAGYVAAANNNQDDLRSTVNKMARRFDYWLNILQTGARLSLVSIDLGAAKLQSETVKGMIYDIGWQGHKLTYNRLNTALVNLRGRENEISRLKDNNTKGEVLASMLTVTGQVIFRKYDHAPDMFENAARTDAANTLATAAAAATEKKAAKKKSRGKSSGFWDGFGGFLGNTLELAGDILDIFT